MKNVRNQLPNSQIESIWDGFIYSVKISCFDKMSIIDGKLYPQLKRFSRIISKEFENSLFFSLKIKLKACNSFSWFNLLLSTPHFWPILSSQSIDFSWEIKGIPRAPPTHDHFKMIPIEKSNKLYNNKNIEEHLDVFTLGYEMKNGVATHTLAQIEIDSLTENCLIGGVPGVGKTTFLRNLIEDIVFKRPDVGILVINLAKYGEHRHYPYCQVKRFHSIEVDGSDKLYIPFGHLSKHYFSDIKRISKTFTAITGLFDHNYRFFSTPLLEYYNRKNRLPKRFGDLFVMALDYLDNNSYAQEEQINLTQMIGMRGRELVINPQLSIILNKNNHNLHFSKDLLG